MQKAAGSYSTYFLTSTQVDAFHRMVGGGLRLVVAPADAASKLKFLRDLRDRTIYRDSAQLGAIIKDYDVALRRAAAGEEAK